MQLGEGCAGRSWAGPVNGRKARWRSRFAAVQLKRLLGKTACRQRNHCVVNTVNRHLQLDTTVWTRQGLAGGRHLFNWSRLNNANPSTVWTRRTPPLRNFSADALRCANLYFRCLELLKFESAHPRFTMRTLCRHRRFLLPKTCDRGRQIFLRNTSAALRGWNLLTHWPATSVLSILGLVACSASASRKQPSGTARTAYLSA